MISTWDGYRSANGQRAVECRFQDTLSINQCRLSECCIQLNGRGSYAMSITMLMIMVR